MVIERVVRSGDKIFVYVQSGNPVGTDEVSSPYHLATIEKKGKWGQTIHFALYLNGTEAISLSHFIP